jgi:hypothetical protein
VLAEDITLDLLILAGIAALFAGAGAFTTAVPAWSVRP